MMDFPLFHAERTKDDNYLDFLQLGNLKWRQLWVPHQKIPCLYEEEIIDIFTEREESPTVR